MAITPAPCPGFPSGETCRDPVTLLIPADAGTPSGGPTRLPVRFAVAHVTCNPWKLYYSDSGPAIERMGGCGN